MKKLSLFLIVLLGTIFTTKAQLGQPELLDKIVSKVDNYYILESELNAQYFQYLSSKQGPPPSRCQLLEGLIVNKMMLAKAEIDSVIVEDLLVESELDSRMAQMESQYGSSNNIVNAFGKSISAIKDDIRSNLKEQMTYNKMQGEIASKVKITPSEVKEFYDEIPKDSLPYLPAQVEVAQIVRLARPTPDQKRVIEDRLLDIKRRVGNGEKFEDFARIYSEDIGSGKRGGDLGFSKRGQMVAPFEAAALKLKPGEMSGVVESEFGYHLIKLEAIRGQEYRASHILIRPEYQKLDLTPAKNYLDSIRTLIEKDTVTFEQKAKELSEDKDTQDNGGFLRNSADFSNRLDFDKTMDPALYLALDTMKVGQISEPMNFRTADGKTGARILYLKEKYPPHFADFEMDYEKLADIAKQRKQSIAMDKWFVDAKDDVFIWVDEEFQECKLDL